jgi:hypothetical protein
MAQQVLDWKDKPLEMNILGEKPFKLMVLKQAGFPVPDFFTIVSNGSGRIETSEEVARAYEKLTKPLIGRSAHPMEGTGFSFSGRFQSIERIARLTDSPEDEKNYVMPLERREDFPPEADIFAIDEEWFKTRTFSLDRAYRDIVGFANPQGDTLPSRKVREYLESNGITDFDHNLMNLLLMEQRQVQVFGMFMTSDQARPNEMVIHFQDRRANLGNWIVYEKENQRLRGEVKGDLEKTLLEFGKLAVDVERKFGKVQQVEMGSSDKGVEIYQARDINIKNPNSVPRFAHYKTFSSGLHSTGVGYFHLPVLVIDALDHIHSEHFATREEALVKAVQPYKQQVKRFVEEHPEYIAVVKDGSLFTGYYSEDTDMFKSKRDRYAELNAITRRAKVVFRGKCQSAIRHEDWDSVETGGINVWLGERELMANLFIHNQIVGEFAKWKARQYVQVGEDRDYTPPNVTLTRSRKSIETGDYIHVLANTDGTFVWTD